MKATEIRTNRKEKEKSLQFNNNSLIPEDDISGKKWQLKDVPKR